MKSKLFAFFLLSVLMLNSAVFAAGDVKSRRVVDTAGIVALLPASDAVAVIDVNRFLNSALPQMLSGNQSILAEVNKSIDDAKTRTGIDFRQFEYVAAGVTATKVGEKKYEFDTVMVARGRVNTGALIAAAKLAANGKYREEKVGERSVSIFEPAEIVQQNLPQGQAKKVGMLSKLFGGKREVAVTSIDGNTLIFGSVEKVRLALSGTSRVGADISGLLSRTTAPVMSFAGKVPDGMSVFLPLENDELGKQVDAIRYLYGSMDVNATATILNATARTTQPADATGLKDTLEGLQMLGKALLSSAKGADKQVYARLVDNVKFAARGNEVSMDLSIAQSDMNQLVGLLTK
jgi:hypothetical protein